MTTPRERPILFNGPMVRAILDGRKTQTRRLVKPIPDSDESIKPLAMKDGNVYMWIARPDGESMLRDGRKALTCPYGQPGDRLWVRESHLLDPPIDGTWPSVGDTFVSVNDIPAQYRNPEHVIYRADGSLGDEWRWRPSIHMPRWASRITLEITDVRVQRVQDISGSDAVAEGIDMDCHDSWHPSVQRSRFQQLWNDTYGADAWNRNDWVWAISFKRVTP